MLQDLRAAAGFFGGVSEDGDVSVRGEEGGVLVKRVGGRGAGGVGDDEEMGGGVCCEEGVEFILDIILDGTAKRERELGRI